MYEHGIVTVVIVMLLLVDSFHPIQEVRRLFHF